MLDVRLITLLPPQPAVSQPASAQNVTTQGGNALLSQLPVGSVLSGFIINRDASGNPVLRTQNGDIVFSSQFFLKIGSEVVIRIQQSAGQNIARLISVNGQPPEAAQNSAAFNKNDVITNQSGTQQTSAPNVAQASANSGTTPAQTTLAGSNISSIVVIPSAQNLSPLPGTSLQFQVLGVNVPAPTAQAPQNSALASLTSNAAPNSAPASASALASLLPTATPANATPANPNPPSNPALLQTTLAAPQATTNIPTAQIAYSMQQAAQVNLPSLLGQTTLATVTGVASDGRVMLESSLGVLRAINVTGAKIGDTLTLRINSVGEANSYTIAVANQSDVPALAPLSTLARTWPSLQLILNLLGFAQNPSGLPNLPQMGVSPNLAATLGSQMLFFVSALKGGDFKGWLGKSAAKTLEDKGYGTLLRQAEGEFRMLARQWLEAPANQWQSLFMPVAVAAEIMQLRAFVKRDKKKDEQGTPTGEEDTRFIVEMDLSQLGEMQLDGLVRRGKEDLQFDLMVRSRQPLPQEMVNEIEAIYHATAALTDYHGRIRFQAVESFPVHPLEDVLPHLSRDVIA